MNNKTTVSRSQDIAWLDDEMAELPLLLTGSQATALEATANARGVSVGQMVRGLLLAFLARMNEPEQRSLHGERVIAQIAQRKEK